MKTLKNLCFNNIYSRTYSNFYAYMKKKECKTFNNFTLTH